MSVHGNSFLFVLGLALVGIAISDASSAPFKIDTIALTGTDGSFGPWMGQGTTFTGFNGEPILNRFGDIAFPGAVRLSSGLTKEGYWLRSAGTNTPLALTGEDGALGPGLGAGVDFKNTVDNAYLGEGGGIVFGGFLSASGSNVSDGVWTRREAGANVPFAREGISGPLGPGMGGDVRYQYFSVGPHIGVDNTVVFGSSIVGTGVDSTNDRGLWKRSASGPANVLFARTGVSDGLGPGLDAGTVFVPYLNLPVLSENGDIIFTGFTNRRDVGLWRHNGTANAPIVLSGTDGSLGPGLGPDQTFANTQSFLEFDTNNRGDAVFKAPLTDGRRGIWRTSAKGHKTFALTGETGPLGPGLGPGNTFAPFNPGDTLVDAILNEEGVVVFDGIVAGNNRHGLWLNSGQENRPIALAGTDGELGPQLGPGVQFTIFNAAAINDRGTVFFTADLSPGVPFNRLLGLWAHHDGHLQKVAAYGEPFDVDPTAGIDLRIVEWVQISTARFVDSNGSAINNFNQVVFSVGFTDDTNGIFVAQIIPEPSPILMLLALAVTAIGRRWRRFERAV